MNEGIKIQRHIGLPENEMAIITDTNTLIHNIVTFELKQKDKEIENLQQRVEQLENIRKEAIKWINEHTENIDRGRYYEDYVETYDLLNILNKGSEE